MLAMLADEKAARQKNLEKQYGFQGFLLCMRLKRALMKRGAKIIFYGRFLRIIKKTGFELPAMVTGMKEE